MSTMSRPRRRAGAQPRRAPRRRPRPARLRERGGDGHADAGEDRHVAALRPRPRTPRRGARAPRPGRRPRARARPARASISARPWVRPGRRLPAGRRSAAASSSRSAGIRPGSARASSLRPRRARSPPARRRSSLPARALAELERAVEVALARSHLGQPQQQHHLVVALVEVGEQRAGLLERARARRPARPPACAACPRTSARCRRPSGRRRRGRRPARSSGWTACPRRRRCSPRSAQRASGTIARTHGSGCGAPRRTAGRRAPPAPRAARARARRPRRAGGSSGPRRRGCRAARPSSPAHPPASARRARRRSPRRSRGRAGRPRPPRGRPIRNAAVASSWLPESSQNQPSETTMRSARRASPVSHRWRSAAIMFSRSAVRRASHSTCSGRRRCGSASSASAAKWRACASLTAASSPRLGEPSRPYSRSVSSMR